MELVKGYKCGRAVMFYDVHDPIENKTVRMPKDTVAELCKSGKIGNAKVQMWDGKPIIRVKGEIPVAKLDSNGNVGENVQPQRRSGNTNVVRKPEIEEPIQDANVHATVVGKINNKAVRKKETVYAGYDMNNIYEQRKLNSEVDYSRVKTLNDLFNMIAGDVGVKDTDSYRKSFGKKVDLSTEVNRIDHNKMLWIQSEMVVYLVNMRQIELRSIWLKYYAAVV